MGPVDMSPDWCVVETAHLAGLNHPKDSVWRFLGILPAGNAHQTWCASGRCLPPECLAEVDASPAKIAELLTPVYLSAEKLPPGKPKSIFLGQCEKCGWIYWGVS